jgi:type II secretory ATPase GspE/PulE/Tfp pilus assembly ATPase PilB-like protein
MKMLLEGGVSPRALGASVRAAVGTHLLSRLCGSAESYRLSRAQAHALEEIAEFAPVLAALKEDGVVESALQWKEMQFKRPVACERCEEGYTGVVGVEEVFVPTRAARELLMQGDVDGAWQEAREAGMLTLPEEALYKAGQGVVSIEEILAGTENGST